MTVPWHSVPDEAKHLVANWKSLSQDPDFVVAAVIKKNRIILVSDDVSMVEREKDILGRGTLYRELSYEETVTVSLGQLAWSKVRTKRD